MTTCPSCGHEFVEEDSEEEQDDEPREPVGECVDVAYQSGMVNGTSLIGQTPTVYPMSQCKRSRWAIPMRRRVGVVHAPIDLSMNFRKIRISLG